MAITKVILVWRLLWLVGLANTARGFIQQQQQQQQQQVQRSFISPPFYRSLSRFPRLGYSSRDDDQKQDQQKLRLKWNVINLLCNNRDSTGNVDKKKNRYLRDIYQSARKEFSSKIYHDQNQHQHQQQEPVISLKNSQLEVVRRFIKSSSYDMDHDGRFGGVSSDGAAAASLQANLVFSMDQPLRYIQKVLSASSSSCEVLTSTSKNNKENDEVVIFCPGLHSPLQQSTKQQEYLSQVLDGMPISLLQVGTHTQQHISKKDDDGHVDINLSADTVLALKKENVMVQDYFPNEGGRYELNGHDMDLLRARVSWQQSEDSTLVGSVQGEKDHITNSADDDRLVETLIKLIDVAVESTRTNQNEPHLVLVAYSATASAIGKALDGWKSMATNNRQNRQQQQQLQHLSLRNRNLGPSKAEAFLRQSVTVVTVGGLCSSYPSGPAYIHVSMHDDNLVSELGGCAKQEDAVVLQALSPYTSSSDVAGGLASYNAHNPQASGIQFLSLVMRTNGIRSFRQLYEVGNQPTPKLDIAPTLFSLNYNINKVGELDLPSDDLLMSMIRATGGQRWLFDHGEGCPVPVAADEDDQDQDIDCWDDDYDVDDILPDLVDAEATIASHLGYGVYEEIYEACNTNKLSDR